MTREWLNRWQLQPDGEEIVTSTSHLVPVRYANSPAMLKVSFAKEEVRGANLMVWWNGNSAARVYRHEGPALLLERASMGQSLRQMAQSGQDEQATRLLCRLACSLHEARTDDAPTSLVALEDWFAKLSPGAARHGGILALSHEVAQELLATQDEIRVLHGDLHHDNVLHFGDRGWLAIDPKGLVGERTFDFVNLLRNPRPEIALQPGRFARQATVIASAAGVNRCRLLRWTLAFAGLSAAWILADGVHPALDLAVAELAAKELGVNPGRGD